MIHRSLQSDLSRWLLWVTLTVSAVAGSVAGLVSFYAAHEAQDELLLQVSRLITLSQATSPEGWITGHNDDAQIVVQKLSDKRLPDKKLSDAKSSLLKSHRYSADGFYSIDSDDDPWRVLVFSANNQRYLIAQQTEIRDEIAIANSLSAVLPIGILTLILLVVIRWVISSKLKPIRDLSQSIDQQSDSNLNPLSLDRVPKEITPFVRAINRLLSRTQDTIDRQRRFIADASHELRTPVAALSLLSENLHNAEQEPERTKRLDLLQQGLDRLNRLIEQLLNLSRIQNLVSSSFQIVRFDEIVRDATALLYPLAEHKSIDLGVTHTTAISLQDQNGGLRQIVENALSNAIRYTLENGRIDISLSIEGDIAVLEVLDSGSGINAEDLDQIFTPFYRGENKGQSGNGLGLSICAEIAKCLNGSIELKNRQQGGLCFKYTQALCDH
jgi:two-component system OmpR family sensor kinase